MSSTSPNSPSTVTFAQFADSWIPEPEPVEAARERAREFGVSPVSPATGRFLTFLAASVQAQTVVEVGTG
ncbi:MAG: methyltransferase, partial [Actinomycetota bacterium]|nr:methyltransferase [Actinomycetota bacterium]